MVDTADSEDFARLAGPFRRELLAHCYRMLGSLHDAEDLVQETFLRAWRAYADYDSSRASLRTWLYRIATNACLTALEGRTRRPLPSGFVGPSDGPERPMERRDEVPWLQPIPDAMLGPGPDDPAAIVAQRGSVRLAFIAALQHLPAKQRAVLLLRDVLALRAAEVANLLDTSPASVNSSLQRARAQLAEVAPAEADVAEPAGTKQRELLDAYMAAFVAADISTLSRLLAEDATLEMPPWLNWFSGREATRGPAWLGALSPCVLPPGGTSPRGRGVTGAVGGKERPPSAGGPALAVSQRTARSPRRTAAASATRDLPRSFRPIPHGPGAWPARSPGTAA